MRAESSKSNDGEALPTGVILMKIWHLFRLENGKEFPLINNQ